MPYGSVLIVDDVETNIYVARGLMSPYELKIDSANSGFEAIDKIKSGKEYDIVFMDHMMPKMDGMETTKIIREMGYTKPVVALTANAVSGQSEVFLRNGFDDFISKPIDVRQLNAVLNRLVRDVQTPELIEATRRQTEEKKALSIDTELQQPTIDPQFAEIFTRDALKVLATLEALVSQNDYSNEDDMRAYVINVHGIKSALANIKQMDLSETARELEAAGREMKLDIVTERTPAFLSALRLFVEELMPKEEKTVVSHEDEDKPFLRGKLLVIKAACEAPDANNAEEALAELRNKTWAQQTGELLSKISEQLLHSDFDDIVDDINKYLQ